MHLLHPVERSESPTMTKFQLKSNEQKMQSQSRLLLKKLRAQLLKARPTWETIHKPKKRVLNRRTIYLNQNHPLHHPSNWPIQLSNTEQKWTKTPCHNTSNYNLSVWIILMLKTNKNCFIQFEGKHFHLRWHLGLGLMDLSIGECSINTLAQYCCTASKMLD